MMLGLERQDQFPHSCDWISIKSSSNVEGLMCRARDYQLDPTGRVAAIIAQTKSFTLVCFGTRGHFGTKQDHTQVS